MPGCAPSFNVAPQSVQPVVRLNRDADERVFALLRWGLAPFSAKEAKIGYTTIDARAEEVASKPTLREALKNRRCLVPADAFFDWQCLDAKLKCSFAIRLMSGEQYAFAGLRESWRHKDGETLETFTVLTADPNGGDGADPQPDAGDPRTEGL